MSKIIKWFKCQMVWEHEGRPEVVGFCILAFLQDFFSWRSLSEIFSVMINEIKVRFFVDKFVI